MEIIYKEESEKHIIDGVIVAKTTVRLPLLIEYPKINTCYESVAKNFIHFSKEKLFCKAETEYNSFCENGGRRSKFATRVRMLHINITEKSENKLSVLLEVYSQNGSDVVDFYRESAIWDTTNQNLLPKKFLKINRKRGVKCDGFYLKNGKIIAYKVLPVYKNSEDIPKKPEDEVRVSRGSIKMREIGNFITEWEAN